MKRFKFIFRLSRAASALCHVPSTQHRSVYRATALALQTWAQQTYRPWMCIKTECRKVNYARAINCESCGEEKPSLLGWVCQSCNTKNHQGIKACKGCGASYDDCKDFWACISCHKNNRKDSIDDNSICGFCSYDMAPKTRSEEELLRIQQEVSERIREQQLAYDTAPVDGDEEDRNSGEGTGIQSLTPVGESSVSEEYPDPWAQPSSPTKSHTPLPSAPGPSVSELESKNKIKKYEFKPYVYKPPETAVSRLNRKPKSVEPSPQGAPGFEWMCREKACGSTNKGDTDICKACSTKIVPADWECDTCGAKNHWCRGMCFNCHTSIAPSWLCLRCRTRTSIYDVGCRNCSSPRPPVEPIDPLTLRTDQKGKAGKGRIAGGRTKGIDWMCQGCRSQNFSWRDRCFSCDLVRDATTEEGAGSGGAGGEPLMDSDGAPMVAVNDNNWLCDSCHASNFRTRTECWQCGRSANGQGAIASSEDEVPTFAKEGFQAGKEDSPASSSILNAWGSKDKDEWTCGKCFSKNFKNRSECHRCGVAKTVAVVTKRVIMKKPVKI
eukprot:Tbor_TRINITY_DN1936_c0_g1::TRINITY_DN1936_c0_g1_i1::g.3523::m.3523